MSKIDKWKILKVRNNWIEVKENENNSFKKIRNIEKKWNLISTVIKRRY